jgi:carbonic anhydrase
MCDVCNRAGPGRREALLGAAGLLMAAAWNRPAVAQPLRAAETPDAAVQLLVEGNARYVANKPNERDFSSGRASRATGQSPFAAILGCADSRVSPELAFDRGPGDLFVVRVAGNYVTSDGLASLEYGAAVLGTKAIMVLGHRSCGAIDATVKALKAGNNYPGHIAGLVRAIKPGIEAEVKKPGDDVMARAVISNVHHNVRRLQQATPILSEMVAKGQLKIVGGVYDLTTGKVTII